MSPAGSESTFKRWIEAAGNPPFVFAMDHKGDLVNTFQVKSTSAVVFADASGRVVTVDTGGDESTFRDALAKAGLA